MERSLCMSEDCPISWKRLTYTVKWKRITALLAFAILLVILVLSILTQKSVQDLRRDLFLAKAIAGNEIKILKEPTTSTFGYRYKSTKGFKEVDLSLLALDGFYPDIPISKVAKPVSDYENPDLSFAVVIDCGSSGSRLFVYRWPKHSGRESDLLEIQHMKTASGKIVVKKIEPGLSSFVSQPHEIVRYITPLLRYAEQNIPPEKHESAPLYILCTAGMRLLPKGEQEKVMNSLKNQVPLLTDFLFEDSHAEIISGQNEGLYSWISLNYILGNMDKVQKSNKTTQRGNIYSVGIIDMGGGSLQIAYEVSSDQHYYPREHILDINLSGDDKIQNHRYRVYVETFLGKGANSIKSAYENMMLNQLSLTASQPTAIPEGRKSIHDPCSSRGMEKYLPSKNGMTILFNGTGDFQACKSKLKTFLHKEKCKINDTECIINGEFRPQIQFNRDSFFGISEFYYTMEDVLHMSGEYDKNSFESEAAKFCEQDWSKSYQLFKHGEYPIADEYRMRTQCLKSAWMSVVFHEGLNFPDKHSKFSSVKMINNNEIQWTLGALLYKARYLPLREIQQAKIKHKAAHNSIFLLNFISQNTMLLILCIIIVMFSVLLYGIRFWLSHNQHRVATLKRVGSSVAYFVHEDVV